MYVLWIKSFAYLKLGICWMLKISKNNRFAVETKINHTHQTPQLCWRSRTSLLVKKNDKTTRMISVSNLWSRLVCHGHPRTMTTTPQYPPVSPNDLAG